jgi:RNA polymerase sigma factor FliA
MSDGPASATGRGNDPMQPTTNSLTIFPAAAIANALKQHMPIVHRVVAALQRRLPPSVSRDDLVAAGMVGLYEALSKGTFMHDPPAMFAAYAAIRVRGAILDELRRLDWFPRRRANADTAAASPSPAPAKRGLELVWIDETESPLPGLAAQGTPAEDLERASSYKALRKAVAELPRAERVVVEMRYFEGLSGKDVASALSLSEARVSQLHARAIGLLKKKAETDSDVSLAA